MRQYRNYILVKIIKKELTGDYNPIIMAFLNGEVPERPKGSDCKSDGSAFGGSNPPLSTIQVKNLRV